MCAVSINYSHNVFLPLCSWARMSELSILVCTPLNYKWEGTQRYKGHTQYNLHSGGRVLRSSSLNHYNPSSPLVFIRNSPNRQTLRPPPHLWIRVGAFRHPAEGFSL
jgi:hypothetical protein